MNENEIKKALYKEKPIAYKVGFGGNDKKDIYEAILKNSNKVIFKIPYEESKNFNNSEPSQLLIRWLNIE